MNSDATARRHAPPGAPRGAARKQHRLITEALDSHEYWQRDRTAQVVITGHAFIHHLRRGH